MRKLFLLCLIIPVSVFAKFYNATVTFTDGTSKKGFVELPEYADDTKLKFKSEEKGKTEKLEIDLIKGFEITSDKNETIKYTTIFLAEPKPFTKDQHKLGTKKSWVRIIKEGKITLYATFDSYNPGNGTGGASTYYIQKGNEKDAYFIADGISGFNININAFSVLKTYSHSIFETDCPKLTELLNKDDLKKNGLSRIVDIYEANCGKK